MVFIASGALLLASDLVSKLRNKSGRSLRVALFIFIVDSVSVLRFVFFVDRIRRGTFLLAK